MIKRSWFGVVLALSGCCSMGDSDCDPLEWFNRPMFVVNGLLDTYLVYPITKGYMVVTPTPLKSGITNFFGNARYPVVFINDFLQAKLVQGLGDIGRFAINSTLGIAGLFDVASTFGLEKHNEDFGQTLGVWGIGEGAYLVIPLLGPTSLRDSTGIPLEAMTSVLFFVTDESVSVPLTVLNAVDRRARAEKAMEKVLAALDPYVFVREGYRQHRVFLIYDGDPPVMEGDDNLDELDELDDLDDLDELNRQPTQNTEKRKKEKIR